MSARPRFPATSCSQCGAGFGPGDAGYSHCKDHVRPVPCAICHAGGVEIDEDDHCAECRPREGELCEEWAKRTQARRGK